MRRFFSGNKSILQLSGANLLVLGLPTILLPIFSRLYSEDDFAQFGIYTSILALFVPFLSLHYQQAIPVPEKKEERDGLTQASLLLAALLSLFCLLALYLVPYFQNAIDPQHLLLNEHLLGWGLLLIGFLFSGYLQIIQHWVLQGQYFGPFARSKAVLAITQSLSRYMLGVGKWVSGGLIWSYTLGLIMQVFSFGSNFKTGKFVGWGEMRVILRKYASFYQFGLPSSVLFALTSALPLVLLGHFYGKSEIGQFSMALRLGSIPVFLLSTAFGQVYFAKAKENKEVLTRVTLDFLQKMIRLAAPLFVLGSFIVLPVGELVIGEQWTLALKILLVLIPALFFNFLVLPLTHLFELENRQDLGFYYAVFAFVFRLGPFAVALMLDLDLMTSFLFLMLGNLTSNLVGFYFGFRLASVKWKEIGVFNSVLCLSVLLIWSIRILFFN